MDNSINQEAIVDDNASVNNNLPINPPILNDATNHNPPSFNDIFNGGGIHKMKKHLAKITGDVKKCPKVPYDVEKQIKSLLKEIQTNKNKRKVSFSEEGGDEVEDAIDEAIAQEEHDDGSSGLYAASLNSSAQEGGNEGEDDPTEANLQQVLADFDD
ncbi:hypothetical protein Ahy_A06g028692 [Arachis hypogaea]|uniref:Uncharacterized protein n=1 Tax=Arachis hypogaea TaxID=3818 RepID=A0A445CRI6_ARAHY|nr:hypothetical protein Ahy_A06g028692 [Arachis hypogaea]